MGITKATLYAALAEIDAKAKNPLGYPKKAGVVAVKFLTAGTFELLAASAAGKIRRIGIGKSEMQPIKIRNDGGLGQDIEIKIGSTTIYKDYIPSLDKTDFYPFYIPTGEAVSVVLSAATETQIVFPWSEVDDTEAGAQLVSLTSSWATLFGPPPAGKAFVPAKVGQEMSIWGYNGDLVSHGWDIRMWDVTTAYDINSSSGAYWGSEEVGPFEDICSPVQGDLRYQMRLQESVDTTAPVMVVGYDIVDEP